MAEKQMKKLAKETAMYGVSSILGKFLNWMMVPLYTYVLANSAEYGIVTNLYAWTALLLVMLTYGMETGFLRFANKNKEEAGKVYSTTLIAVGTTSTIFALCCIFFSHPIANTLGYAKHPEWIAMLGTVVAFDAFGCIPYVYLRFKNRPIRFVALNLFAIFVNIFFNVFFLVICPRIMHKSPELISWFYNPDYGVGYVFISNIFSTALVTIALLFDVFVVKFEFDKALLKKMLQYSLPLVILGIAGIMNQTLDKILFPFLLHGEVGKAELGVYGATSKIALVMTMFTQAFRYSYEPFIFAQKKDKNSLETYADAMKYYILIALFIFLGMVLYMDIFKYIIQYKYWVGLKVVPIVMFSFIFQGIFFNLSLWYKLTDKTMYGAWFSILGTVIIVVLNIVLVPLYSYMGCAWAAFACYFVIMMISYYYGQKHMPIKYDLKTIGLYTVVTVALYAISTFINTPYTLLNIGLKSILMVAYLVLLIKRDFPLRSIPVINRFFK
ncbi:MAG TPA: polysaccharide biosynthesis C-terminal domain-containing protein [Paludibacter sp.]|nr:polysaccharide biosynthesis C-terminal domain-containing protein [Paludibacter sp.]